MAHVAVLPRVFLVTTTPDELRKLAVRMEKAVLSVKLGDICWVETWHGKDCSIQFHFDQEDCTKEHPSGAKT